MNQANDRSSKWIIQHLGVSVLRIAGFTDFLWWQPVANEQVAPRRIPDGLIIAQHPGRENPTHYLVEIETYADRSLAQQVAEDIKLVWLNFSVVPEVIVLILKQRGPSEPLRSFNQRSPSGQVEFVFRWPVIQLWELSAEVLLAQNDVGLVPWIPLTSSQLPDEELIRRCRAMIDEQATNESQHEALLTVTQILAGPRYNRDLINSILGKGNNMIRIESPFLDEAREYWRAKYEAVGIEKGIELGVEKGRQEGLQEGERASLRETIIDTLKTRFDSLSESTEGLNQIDEIRVLKVLRKLSVTCNSESEFWAGFRSCLQ